MQLEGLGELKNPMASFRIEPVTFRLVAWCFNQICYHVSLWRRRRKEREHLKYIL
jgi:hypothetical protein